MGRRLDTKPATAPQARNDAKAETSLQARELPPVSRLDEVTLKRRIHTRTAISRQLPAQETRSRELADEIIGLEVERRRLRSQVASLRNPRIARPASTHTRLGGADEWRRLERDLHDGVQNELVALMAHLTLAREDPDTPPGLADMLARLEARAQAALDSVRNIARGIYPPVLADFGLEQAWGAPAGRGPRGGRAPAPPPTTGVRVVGTAPRSAEEVEEAVYFACSEAIQNVAKHAGRAAQVNLRLHHHHGRLTVRIADHGRGFDPAHTPEGAGLQNIRDRMDDLGGTVNLTSNPGRGTTLTISLAWPRPADRPR